MARMFGFPWLDRTGLGNMLFPWARCFVWCRKTGVPMIAPFWIKVRLGPYLRRERDKRNYWRLFRHDGYVAGAKRLLILLAGVKIPEGEVQSPSNASKRPTVVVFRGMQGYFTPIIRQHETILRELLRIAKPGSIGEAPVEKFIGVHVRRGDFSVPEADWILRAGGHNYRIPLSWYIAAVEELRRAVGDEVSVLVFSDGRDDELRPLLTMPGVFRSPSRNALDDMLILARASAIVASGSTFSMWSSFLGQVPTVWYPGQRRQRVVLNSEGSEKELEPEWEPGLPLPTAFIEAVEKRLKKTL